MSNLSTFSKTTIRHAKAGVLRAALSVPFRTALGQHSFLENVLLQIELENGIRGFGEAGVAPHITGETIENTLQNLESFSLSLCGQDIHQLVIASEAKQSSGAEIALSPVLLAMTAKLAKNSCALAALQMATLDAWTQQKGIPFWKFFGNSLKVLKTDMTVVLGTLSEAEEAANEISARGFGAIKIKIGGDEKEDLKRVIAVKKMAKKSKIYLDGNQGLTAEATLQFLKALGKAGIQPDLIEQPVPKQDLEGLGKVTREAKTVVIADESVSTYEDAARLIQGKYAHGINIKFMKSGILEARRIAEFAKKNGLKLMIGGMMETELGTTASAHFAAGFGGFDYIDLDSQFFLREKVMNNSFVRANGTYDLSQIRRGIGVKPRFDLFS